MSQINKSKEQQEAYYLKEFDKSITKITRLQIMLESEEERLFQFMKGHEEALDKMLIAKELE